jgi:hypothetical protein
MDKSSTTAIVDFPLRGEWRAINTPAANVPSHGTDFFGQRYAIDFVQMDATGTWYYEGGVPQLLRHVTIGLAASRFFCWGQPVHSAFAGNVLAARDGGPDRARVQLGWELLRATVPPPGAVAPGDYRPLAGNYVLVEGAEGVALYAHLQCGSVRVATGQRLAVGDVLGAVGNSGNSTMPHLHFHLMDSPEASTARGLPCAFRGYTRWTSAGWEAVSHGVPGPFERIRAV